MFKFENTHIFTGYVKQLLHDFNLPKYRVYTSDFAKYKEEHGEQQGRTPLVLLSYRRLDDIVHDHVNDQFHQANESAGSRCCGIMTAVPTCR